MYHVSAQGIDERMINVHYYYYYVYLLRRISNTDTCQFGLPIPFFYFFYFFRLFVCLFV